MDLLDQIQNLLLNHSIPDTVLFTLGGMDIKLRHALIAGIVLLLLIGLRALARRSKEQPGGFRRRYTPEWEQVGREGEIRAARIIAGALRPTDRHLRNVAICVDDRETELDNVIVNKNGVFIIEVKAYTGELIGGEDDYEWRKLKVSESGNLYEKEVKNPIRQVKRQVYLLSQYLKQFGISVWIEGYVIILDAQSSIESRYILRNAADIERAIDEPGKQHLSSEKINDIVAVLM